MSPLVACSIPIVVPTARLCTPRLEAFVDRVASAKLTLVGAPAGAGKTTALLHWATRLQERGQRVAWLTLDDRNREAGGLCDAIARSMQHAVPGWIFPGGCSDAPAEDQAGCLSDAWLAVAEPVVLFLDDADRLAAGGLRLLRSLIACLPPNARLVIASRLVPDLAVSRLRVFGEVVELGLRELRLTAPEIAWALGEAMPEADRSALAEATDGWAACVAMAARSLAAGIDPQATLRAVSGRAASMTAFFDEAVIDRIEPGLARFLVDTSFLAILTPALCDAATGRNDGLALLTEAARSNLFIEPLNEEHTRYRLMRPFRDFLCRRLEETRPGAERRMCQAVARHLLEAGHVSEALDHAARAGDQAFLAGLLETHCEALTYGGDILRVVQFAGLLDDAALDRLPRLTLILAWASIRSLKLGAARTLIKRAWARLSVLQAAAGDPAEIEWLRLVLLHRETMVAAAEDDFETVEVNSELLMPRLVGQPYLLCSIQAQLMAARREQYRLAELPALEARARATLVAPGCDFAAITLEVAVGPGLMAVGKLDEAIRALERGYALGVRFAGEGSSLAALAALPLAEALYERNELKRASELIELHLDVAREFSFADQLISGYLTRTRICQARGDLTGAFRTIEDGLKVALERNLQRLRMSMVSEKIRLMLRNGQASRAAEIASASGIHGPGSLFAPGARPTTLDELRAMAWCRLSLSQDRIQDVTALVKQWRRLAATRGATHSMIKWSLLLAVCLTMEGELHSAQRTLRDAAAAASEGRWIRCFLDEGRVVRTLIAECLGRSNLAPGPVDQFYIEIMTAFGDHPGATMPAAEPASGDLALYGRLLPRELEILSLVGTGMRNREIGTRLGLTEGTVKWYMTQIYDKVGVRRRPQAVDRARMFGLLA